MIDHYKIVALFATTNNVNLITLYHSILNIYHRSLPIEKQDFSDRRVKSSDFFQMTININKTLFFKSRCKISGAAIFFFLQLRKNNFLTSRINEKNGNFF